MGIPVYVNIGPFVDILGSLTKLTYLDMSSIFTGSVSGGMDSMD